MKLKVNISSPSFRYDDGLYIATGTIYGTAGCTSVVFNVISMKILSSIRRRKDHPINFTQRCLNMINIIQCLPSAILVCAACYNRKWTWGTGLCQFEAFWTYLTALAIINILVALAWRYNKLINLKNESTLIQKISWKQHKVVLICILMALVCSVPPFLGWGSYGLDGIGISCSLLWHRKDFKSRSFIIFTIFIAFIVPLVSIVVMYTSIYWRVRKNSPPSRQNATITNARKLAEEKIMKLGSIMSGIFFISWSPYAIASTIEMVKTGYLPPLLMTIPGIIAKASTLLTPIVYYFTQKQFRMELRRILHFNRNKRGLDSGLELKTRHKQQRLLIESQKT